MVDIQNLETVTLSEYNFETKGTPTDAVSPSPLFELVQIKIIVQIYFTPAEIYRLTLALLATQQ